MHIGKVKIDNFTVLAPLAGITNLPFRVLVKSTGCGLVYSEMVSANGLTHKSPKTIALTSSVEEEKPLSIQIFGSDPYQMADAAQILESLGADIIDINFGCSVKKILKTGSGAALMKDKKTTEKILNKIKKSISVPLTIKIRSGWNPSGNDAIDIANIAQNCGVNAIAVHPRTAQQGFKGSADWSIIKKIKKIMKIPIIGNGDIKNPSDALRMKKVTNCDYIMIGRAALENPLIFKQIIEINKENKVELSNKKEQFTIMIQFVENLVNYFGEKKACFIMRNQLSRFIKGMKGSSNFRKSTHLISSKKEALNLILNYKNYVFEE